MDYRTTLSDVQTRFVIALRSEWEAIRVAESGDPVRVLATAKDAAKAVLEGAAWPNTEALEEILMIGANTCATAVLLYGEYPRLRGACQTLHREVVARGWQEGGPSGLLDASEVGNLEKAVAQGQLYDP